MEPTPKIGEPLNAERQGPRPRRKLSDKTITIRQREIQAVDLKAAGYTYQAIADRLGYKSKGAVHQAVMRTLDRSTKMATDDLREITIKRLDSLLVAVWPFALGIHVSQQPHRKPDMAALDRVLAIETLRARMLGLNAPEKIDVRALVMQMADAEGFNDEEKRDAVEYVEHHLRELRAGT